MGCEPPTVTPGASRVLYQSSATVGTDAGGLNGAAEGSTSGGRFLPDGPTSLAEYASTIRPWANPMS